MISAISRLIKNLPEKSLKTYFSGVHPAIAENVDWDAGDQSIRKKLLEISSTISGDTLAVLGSDAERIDSLTDELGQSILKHFVKDEEVDEYYQLANEHDRVVWMFLKDTTRFAEVEDWWYVDTKRQGRMWEAFVGPDNIQIATDEGHRSAFEAKLMGLFRAAGKMKVEIYERTRSDAEENKTSVIHIVVYREDLPSTQLAFEDENLVSRIVRPVKEVALTYEPDNGQIEIIAEGKEQRKSIAIIFAETLLQSEIDGENIPLRQYHIQKLLNPVVLSFDPEDGIESVRVTMLKVARPNSNNTVTLDVATKEERKIYDVSKEYFGENDPLKSGFRLKQVRISIKFMPDHESRRGKVLHVTIREPNGCNLKSKSHKEKLIGEKYLERWELVETLQ
jgi:hypothetical protein